jgi:hypothetical protein
MMDQKPTSKEHLDSLLKGYSFTSLQGVFVVPNEKTVESVTLTAVEEWGLNTAIWMPPS